MNEHDDVICQVRESFSGLRMEMPVERLFARSRVRQRLRLSGLTAAAAATAGVIAAVTLTLSGPAHTRPASPQPSSPGSIKLAAFSVSSGPGDSTTLILYKGPKYSRLDPTALREALARHGIPALVTVGTFCRSTGGAPDSLGQVIHPLNLGDGPAMVINGRAMPPGTQLSIGSFHGHVRMTLIEDGAPVYCSSTPHQPAGSNTAVRDLNPGGRQ